MTLTKRHWRRVRSRALQVAITLFGLLLLTFFIGRVMPLDPVCWCTCCKMAVSIIPG